MFNPRKDLEKEIVDTRAAREKYSNSADWDKELIAEFQETDPATADFIEIGSRSISIRFPISKAG